MDAVVTKNATTKSTYAWMDAGADHPKVQALLVKLQDAVEKENAGLEITESGAEFTVSNPASEREVTFLFKAAANPDTLDYHVDEWIKRQLDKLMGRKAQRAKSPLDGKKRTKREANAKDGRSNESTE